MHVGAAQILGRNDLAGRGLHQRRAGEKNRALAAHDHRLVRHRRHIGAAGGAGAHHDGDLRDAGGRHVGLIVEDAAEMIAIGKHLVLVRQIGAARIDQIQARQPVLRRDLLRAQMFLHRQRIIRAALHRGVVDHDHALAARHAADAGDDAGRRAPPRHTSRARRVGRSPETASPDRAAPECGRAAAVSRARHGDRATPCRRPDRRSRPGRAGRRPARPSPPRWPGSRRRAGRWCFP